MLNDRDIANSALEMSKHTIEDLTKAGLECSGNLKQTLLQMRNQCEQSQDRLAQLSMAKGWYRPAPPAAPQDIQAVAGFFQAAVKEPTLRI